MRTHLSGRMVVPGEVTGHPLEGWSYPRRQGCWSVILSSRVGYGKTTRVCFVCHPSSDLCSVTKGVTSPCKTGNHPQVPENVR